MLSPKAGPEFFNKQTVKISIFSIFEFLFCVTRIYLSVIFKLHVRKCIFNISGQSGQVHTTSSPTQKKTGPDCVYPPCSIYFYVGPSFSFIAKRHDNTSNDPIYNHANFICFPAKKKPAANPPSPIQ